MQAACEKTDSFLRTVSHIWFLSSVLKGFSSYPSATEAFLIFVK